jgi:hypothetical protein
MATAPGTEPHAGFHHHHHQPGCREQAAYRPCGAEPGHVPPPRRSNRVAAPAATYINSRLAHGDSPLRVSAAAQRITPELRPAHRSAARCHPPSPSSPPSPRGGALQANATGHMTAPTGTMRAVQYDKYGGGAQGLKVRSSSTTAF